MVLFTGKGIDRDDQDRYGLTVSQYLSDRVVEGDTNFVKNHRAG